MRKLLRLQRLANPGDTNKTIFPTYASPLRPKYNLEKENHAQRSQNSPYSFHYSRYFMPSQSKTVELIERRHISFQTTRTNSHNNLLHLSVRWQSPSTGRTRPVSHEKTRSKNRCLSTAAPLSLFFFLSKSTG